MDKYFAQFASYIFHPIALPIYAVALFATTNSEFAIYIDPKRIFRLALIFVGITFVAPLLYIFFLKSVGAVNNLSDPSKGSRLRISMVVMVFYVITYYLFKRLPLNEIYFDLGIGVTISIAIATIISIWYKISLHGMAMGGLLGAQCALFAMHNYLKLDILLLLILITGLVGTSRVILKAHTSAQVYSGISLGFFVVGGFLYFI